MELSDVSEAFPIIIILYCQLMSDNDNKVKLLSFALQAQHLHTLIQYLAIQVFKDGLRSAKKGKEVTLNLKLLHPGVDFFLKSQ